MRVSLSPNRFKVNAFYAVVFFKSKRKIYLSSYRGVILRNTGADPPVFSHGGFSKALTSLHKVVERSIHINALLNVIAGKICLFEISFIICGRFVVLLFQHVGEYFIKVTFLTVACSEKTVLTVGLVKCDNKLGSLLAGFCKVRNACNRRGITALVVADPLLVLVQFVNIFLRGAVCIVSVLFRKIGVG